MLTVLFATRNRAAMLRRVLECFTRLQSPPGGWKLVVADNGSTDDTRAVLGRYALRLPMEVVDAGRPGKNAALNAALAHLAGDLSVHTDDDVLPRADWLTAFRAAADTRPECLLFGGTVEPEWPQEAPDWLLRSRRHHAILYARCVQPDGPCRTTALFGPNWAVRPSVFRTGLRFDETIGPDDSKPFYAMGSETEFIGRLAEQGAQAWFVAGAVVSHIVRPDQLAERWVLDRAYRNGLGVGITGRPRCLAGPRLGGVPWRLLARRAAYRGLAMAARPLPPTPLRLRVLFQERWLAGLATSVRANLSTCNESRRKNLATARAFTPQVETRGPINANVPADGLFGGGPECRARAGATNRARSHLHPAADDASDPTDPAAAAAAGRV
ncbi:MAG: glycosyltransferase [Acetobacteraceae bacterium]|nr:glycosyltransferase [Acetobacteraceae bacterium]